MRLGFVNFFQKVLDKEMYDQENTTQLLIRWTVAGTLLFVLLLCLIQTVYAHRNLTQLSWTEAYIGFMLMIMSYHIVVVPLTNHMMNEALVLNAMFQ